MRQVASLCYYCATHSSLHPSCMFMLPVGRLIGSVRGPTVGCVYALLAIRFVHTVHCLLCFQVTTSRVKLASRRSTGKPNIQLPLAVHSKLVIRRP